jgi:hypothetical protein
MAGGDAFGKYEMSGATPQRFKANQSPIRPKPVKWQEFASQAS